jgi:hypothetical protein
MSGVALLAPNPLDLHRLAGLLDEIEFEVDPGNELVTITSVPFPLQVVGYGTDAVVVCHPDFPEWVCKVVHRTRLTTLADEYAAYQRLPPSPYFASCVDRGEFYLILSYEPGPTLYECLEHGIVIPKQVIIDVEGARRHARSVGLEPRDIHLRNVLLQGDRAKVIDVAKFVPGGRPDPLWDHFAQGYRDFYPLIRGRAVPRQLIETVKALYFQARSEGISIDALGEQALALAGLALAS